MRMLMNNLDPEVAEHPESLIVYGGSGKAARNWESYAAIVKTLQRLRSDETMLVQSGKPVGVFRTHDEAPRVLIANANLVPKWGTWDEFRRLEALGLTMYGIWVHGRMIERRVGAYLLEFVRLIGFATILPLVFQAEGSMLSGTLAIGWAVVSSIWLVVLLNKYGKNKKRVKVSHPVSA